MAFIRVDQLIFHLNTSIYTTVHYTHTHSHTKSYFTINLQYYKKCSSLTIIKAVHVTIKYSCIVHGYIVHNAILMHSCPWLYMQLSLVFVCLCVCVCVAIAIVGSMLHDIVYNMSHLLLVYKGVHGLSTHIFFRCVIMIDWLLLLLFAHSSFLSHILYVQLNQLNCYILIHNGEWHVNSKFNIISSGQVEGFDKIWRITSRATCAAGVAVLTIPENIS